ncbi:Probable serine/threonine-protein kinase PIX13 [Linum grandiflorum]
MGNCIPSRSHVDKVDNSTNGYVVETAASDGKEVLGDGAVKVFKLAELKSATRNFRPDTVLGEGISSVVFQGWVDGVTLAPCKAGSGIPIAVKRIIDLDTSRAPHEWQAEVKFLGAISHPNVVKLLGYCWEEDELLLVYECMQGGTLDNCLFRSTFFYTTSNLSLLYLLIIWDLKVTRANPISSSNSYNEGGSEPLSWEIRMRIAVDVAGGLAFLHSLERGGVDHDFKTSSILLDKNFNAKLSDSGLAEFRTTTVLTSPMSPPIGGIGSFKLITYDYSAPEYVATGHLSSKSIVYTFGVVLSELLTGLRALDRNRPAGQRMLVEWVKPYLSNRRNVKKIMDSRLGDQYPLNAALKVSQLVSLCLGANPKTRPSMEEVLQALVKIRDHGKS